MRNLKRVLTMVMAIAMMISLMTVGAGATFQDQAKVKNETAVNMNVALGIIKGREDGNFDPAGDVTRGEMAKMVCVAFNGGNEPPLMTKAVPTYKDIKGHWAEKYIEYCSTLGIIAGLGDGNFNPNGKVTYTQGAKMMLVALGYDATVEGFNGATWSIKIGVAAAQKNLDKDIVVDPNAPLNRDNAAQMIWNALNAKMVKYENSLTSVNGVLQNIKTAEEYIDFRTLLSNKYSQADYDGQLTKFSYNSTKEEWTYTVENKDAKEAKDRLMTFTNTVDYTALFGQNVNVVYKLDGSKVDKVFGMYADDCVTLFSGVVNDLTVKTDTVKFKDKTYDLDSGASKDTIVYTYTYNKEFKTAQTVTSDGKLATLANVIAAPQNAYTFNAIDSDDDGKVDFLVVYPYIVKEVTYAGDKTITAGTSYTIADCDVYKGIKKDDYAKIADKLYTATNTTRIDKVDQMVNGKVTSRTGNDYYIDGKLYTLAAGVTMSVGDTVKDAVVVNNFIFDADTNGSTKIQDYAVVISASGKAAGSVNGNQAKLIFSDGTKKIVDTDVDYSDGPSGLKYTNKLVTYTINSDKDYELKLATYPADGKGTGFDKATASGTILNKDDSAGKSGKCKYLNGWNIADDAVIFVKNNKEDTFEIITGAKLLNTSIGDGTSAYFVLNGAFATKNSSNGYNTVNMAYIINTGNKLTSADSLFAYATDGTGEKENKDKKNVYAYKLWDGTKEIDVLATTSVKVEVFKGDVVKYTLNSDGYADKVERVATTGASTPNVRAIVAYDGKYIQLAGSDKRYEIDKDDTKIIGIDNKDQKGVLSPNIQLADKASDGSYIPNAVIMLASNGTDLDAIVIDTRNNMSDTVKTISATDVTTDTALQKLFDDYNTVIVAGNYAPDYAIDMKTGQSLSVTNNFAPTAAITGTGTLAVGGNFAPTANVNVNALKVTGATTLTNTLTVAGNFAPTAAITGTGTLAVTGDFTPAANVTVNALTVTGATTLTNTLTVAGKFEPTAAITGTGTLAVAGNFAPTANVTVNALNVTVGTTTVATGKTLTVNGAFAPTTAVAVNGTGALTVNGAFTPAAVTVAGTLTVNGALTNAVAITGAGTLTATSISNYANAQTANIIVTGDVAATTLLAKNYTFQGNVTGAMTFDAASVVTFAKSVDIGVVIPTAKAGVAGAKVMFAVAPTNLVVTTNASNGFFVNTGTTVLTLVTDIATNTLYTNTATAGGGANNGWVK